MVSDFHDIVLSFFHENADAISRLSFDQIQENAVSDISNSSYAYDKSIEDLSKLIDSSEEQKRITQKVENLWTGGSLLQPKEELISQINLLEQQSDLREKESIARQLVISLNIIYMFCDALRIILTNSHANI